MRKSLLLLFIAILGSNVYGQTVALIKDIIPGSNGSNPQLFHLVNGKILFFAGNTQELYSTDGTTAGTVLVKQINPSGNALHGKNNWAIMNNKAYFIADDGVNGSELWVTDGTTAGTYLLKDINPTSGVGQNSQAYFMLTLGNIVLFPANDGVHGLELWMTDGTSAGTVMVKEIAVVNNSGINTGTEAIIYNNNLYFAAGPYGNTELWKSDGTTTETVQVADINTSGSAEVKGFAIFNNTLFFAATNGTSGMEIWKSDGTAANTVMVKDINPSGNGYSNLMLGAINTGVFFYGTNGTQGSEVWFTDGTSAGTMMLKDIYVGSGSCNIYADHFAVSNDKLFFGAENTTYGNELYVSDGTTSGTKLVKDIYANSSHSYPFHMVPLGSGIIFSADNGINGTQVWTSDGTASGTVLQAIINPSGNAYPAEFFVYDVNNVLFQAQESTAGMELYAWLNAPVLGIMNTENYSSITVAPNPFESNTTITFENATMIEQVTVCNSIGKVIQSISFDQDVSEIKIQLTNEPSGVYFIHATGKDGSVYNGKVVKH